MDEKVFEHPSKKEVKLRGYYFLTGKSFFRKWEQLFKRNELIIKMISFLFIKSMYSFAKRKYFLYIESTQHVLEVGNYIGRYLK
jgi:hypothetical protein